MAWALAETSYIWWRSYTAYANKSFYYLGIWIKELELLLT